MSRSEVFRINLSDGSTLRTSDDVAYVWLELGGRTGWSRVRSQSDFENSRLLLVPRRLDPQLSAQVLDMDPDTLVSQGASWGAVVVDAGRSTPELSFLQKVREARKESRLGEEYTRPESTQGRNILLTRVSTAEVMDLVGVHGLDVAAQVVPLVSLPFREEVLHALGHSRVDDLLALYDFPEDVAWQVMRSEAFDASNIDVTQDTAIGLAGNPSLPSGKQRDLLQVLLTQYVEGDQQAEAPLVRVLKSSGLSEDAALFAAENLDDMPARAARALAGNEVASWLWLRELLDVHEDPEVALLSASVGEVTPAREKRFAANQDPLVRARVLGGSPLHGQWDPDDPVHVRTLRRVDDPLDSGDWSLEPSFVNPQDWGAYSAARRWAAVADEYPEAEKTLRQAADLHNKSYGLIGSGVADPARLAKAGAARTLASFSTLLPLLGLDEGCSYQVEDVRLAAVKAVAAQHADPEVLEWEHPLIRAVLDAVAVEAELAKKV